MIQFKIDYFLFSRAALNGKATYLLTKVYVQLHACEQLQKVFHFQNFIRFQKFHNQNMHQEILTNLDFFAHPPIRLKPQAQTDMKIPPPTFGPW